MIRHIAVQTWQKFNLPQPFLLYLLGIGASGGILLLWGVGQVYQSDLQVEFWLLLTLAVLTAFTTSTLKVGDVTISPCHHVTNHAAILRRTVCKMPPLR